MLARISRETIASLVTFSHLCIFLSSLSFLMVVSAIAVTFLSLYLEREGRTIVYIV